MRRLKAAAVKSTGRGGRVWCAQRPPTAHGAAFQSRAFDIDRRVAYLLLDDGKLETGLRHGGVKMEASVRFAQRLVVALLMLGMTAAGARAAQDVSATVSIDPPAGCLPIGATVTILVNLENQTGSSQPADFTLTLAPGWVVLAGTCTPSTGMCTIVDSSTVTWSGTLANAQSATVSLQAEVVAGAQLCANLVAHIGSETLTAQVCGSACGAAAPALGRWQGLLVAGLLLAVGAALTTLRRRA